MCIYIYICVCGFVQLSVLHSRLSRKHYKVLRVLNITIHSLSHSCIRSFIDSLVYYGVFKQTVAAWRYQPQIYVLIEYLHLKKLISFSVKLLICANRHNKNILKWRNTIKVKQKQQNRIENITKIKEEQKKCKMLQSQQRLKTKIYLFFWATIFTKNKFFFTI